MNNLLEIKNIVKDYDKHRALNDVSFNIPKGSIFGLLGPNGAGKTSLIRILTGITYPDAGEILFNGEPLEQKHFLEMGYLPEERGLYKKMLVGEQLLYLAELRGLKEKDARTKIKLWADRFDLKPWLTKKVEDLSKGMQQKVQFIATVIHEPKLLILDEPFSGFDPVNADLLRDEILRLQQNGATVIFSTHRMETVEELCDYVGMINKSELVLYGEKQEVKNRFAVKTLDVSIANNVEQLTNLQFITCDILKTEMNKAGLAINLALKEGFSINQLLSELLHHNIEIQSLNAHLPTMREIFINMVKGETELSAKPTVE